MLGLRDNKLLLGTLLFLIIYWGGGPFIPRDPYPFLSTGVSLGLMGAGFGLVAFYTNGVIDILFRKRRLSEEPGSHLAVYGSWLAGAAAIVGGLFNLVWTANGNPDAWTGTVYSNFGRVLTAASYALLLFSPYVGRQITIVPKQSVLLMLSFVAILAAFVIGYQIRPVETPNWPQDIWYPIDRPICPVDRPIWGVLDSKIYHTPGSQYRKLVVPDRCYASEWEARRAGFRPPMPQ